VRPPPRWLLLLNQQKSFGEGGRKEAQLLAKKVSYVLITSPKPQSIQTQRQKTTQPQTQKEKTKDKKEERKKKSFNPQKEGKKG
jgi:hypothetical protein